MTRTNTSNIRTYIIVGSLVGGAIGYLFKVPSGKKIRRAITHPNDIAENLDEARMFIERKAKAVSDRAQAVLDRAYQGMEAGRNAFLEAEERYRSNVRGMERTNNEIAAKVHKGVDNFSKTANEVEKTVLDPLYECGALLYGIQRGICTLFGRRGQVAAFPSGDTVTG